MGSRVLLNRGGVRIITFFFFCYSLLFFFVHTLGMGEMYLANAMVLLQHRSGSHAMAGGAGESGIG